MALFIKSTDSQSATSIHAVENQKPVERISFLDFFMIAQKKFPGIISTDFFQSNMKKVIENSVKSVGKADHYQDENIPSDRFMSSVFTVKKAEGHQNMILNSATSRYFETIKTTIIQNVLKTEWRQIKLLNDSERMFTESTAYYTTAAKDVTLALVGKGISKLADKPINHIKKIGEKRISNAIASGEFTKSTGEKVSKYFGLAINQAKKADDYASAIKKAFKKPTNNINFSDATALNYSTGNHISEQGMVRANIITKGFDIITDFHPIVKLGKTVLSTGLNMALGYEYQATAKRMRGIEDKHARAEHQFKRNIAEAIIEDIRFLTQEEIKQLIMISGHEHLMRSIT